jgi:hypothetical protein
MSAGVDIEWDEAREERARRETVPAGRPSGAPRSGVVTIPSARVPELPSTEPEDEAPRG